MTTSSFYQNNPTPTEVLSTEELLEQANAALIQVAADAASASASQTAAATSASNAATSASAAAGSASQAAATAANVQAQVDVATAAADAASASAASASTSSTNAQTAATNAAASEATATSSVAITTTARDAAIAARTAAETARDAAQASQTAAATSATNAAGSASTASTHASTATTKAGEASTSATNAATSATTATTKAGEASTSASNAATSATNASNSATAAATSATNASNSATAAATSAAAAQVYDPTNFQSRRNRLYNPSAQVSQEYSFATQTVSSAVLADCWIGSHSGGAYSYSLPQVATPGGAERRMRLSVTTAKSPLNTATDVLGLFTVIEGFDVADLLWGTAQAKSITLRFGVRAPAGTYVVAFRNGGPNRSRVVPFTISAGEANTDVVRTITIPGDTTGTWARDNTAGLRVSFVFAIAPTHVNATTATDQWVNGSFYGTTTQTNGLASTANTFDIFDVGLYDGTSAPAFQVPDYQATLHKCQRYFQPMYTYIRNYAQLAGHPVAITIPYLVPMRAAGSATLILNSSSVNVASFTPTPGAHGLALTFTATAAGDFYSERTYWINARL